MATFKVIYWKNNFLTIDMVEADSVESAREQFKNWITIDSITMVNA